MASQVALSNLDADHLIPLQGSLQQILSTKLAEFTFAHVVDGIPVDDDPPQLYFANPRPWHGAPSDAAVQEVLEWRSVFKVEDLAIARDVVQEYQNTFQGTRGFKIRLIEMIAVCLHRVAAELFSHTNKPPYKCPRPPSPKPKRYDLFPTAMPKIPGSDGEEIQLSPVEDEQVPVKIQPTFLYHKDYTFHEQYPMGIPDMVGYWAEYRLLGGVVLIDRGESEQELRDIYLHPNSAYRVFSLSDEQIDQFITFCLDDANSVPFPCPMEAGWAAHRIFPEDTFDLHIFRDKFERIQKPPVPHPEGITVHPRRPLLDDNPDAIMLRQKVQELDRENDARRANGDW